LLVGSQMKYSQMIKLSSLLLLSSKETHGCGASFG
jgi:hypothetical protein